MMTDQLRGMFDGRPTGWKARRVDQGYAKSDPLVIGQLCCDVIGALG